MRLFSTGLATLSALLAADSAVAQQQLTASDRLEIMELASRHNFAIDAMDVQAYGQTYAQDAVLLGPNGTLSGREAIMQGLVDYRPKAAGNRHHSFNHVIVGNADGSASMMSYFLTIKVQTSTPSREVPYTLSSAMHRDQLRRENGRWVIARREQVGVSTRREPW